MPVIDSSPSAVTQSEGDAVSPQDVSSQSSSSSSTSTIETSSTNSSSSTTGEIEGGAATEGTRSSEIKEQKESKNPKELHKEEVLGPKTGIYFGIFGGAAFPMSNGISALSSPPLFSAGGQSHGDTAGVGGIQVGYNFSGYKMDSQGKYWLQPAAQFEAYYIGQENISSTLVGGISGTKSTNIPYGFSSQLNMGIFVVDGLIRFVNPTKIVPYLGGGIGGAYLASSGTNMIAPNGLNLLTGHSYSQGAFVGQGIAGVQYNFTDHWSAFIEYKILWIKNTEFSYLRTNGDSMLIKYPQSFNMALGGIRYNF
ncbi:outer membrane protein [Methylacidiphilum caldifontis]|nr:outer membrane beta-barrel protein [Methylacidiphilum caldifontis]